jgi:hypothetical protein
MPGVLGEHHPQVTLTEDQHSVGAYPVDGAYPAFGDRVRAGCLRRCRDDLEADRGEHAVEAGGEFAVADEKPKPVCLRSQIYEQIPGLRATHTPFGLAVTLARWTRRLPISMKNSTWIRLSSTVSTVKKSHASMVLACADRNSV